MSKTQELTRAQAEEMRQGLTPNISTSTRQVPGGFIITGTTQWANDEGDVFMQQRDEAVCSSRTGVGAYIERYHFSYTFMEPCK